MQPIQFYTLVYVEIVQMVIISILLYYSWFTICFDLLLDTETYVITLSTKSKTMKFYIYTSFITKRS